MTILFDATKPVKTTRNRPFGLGLGRYQAERLPIGPSDADRAWAAYELNKDARDYDVLVSAEDLRIERLAEEAYQMDLYCRGIIFA